MNASYFEKRITEKPLSQAPRFLSPILVRCWKTAICSAASSLARVFNLIHEEPSKEDPERNQFVMHLSPRGKDDDSKTTLPLSNRQIVPTLLSY